MKSRPYIEYIKVVKDHWTIKQCMKFLRNYLEKIYF